MSPVRAIGYGQRHGQSGRRRRGYEGPYRPMRDPSGNRPVFNGMHFKRSRLAEIITVTTGAVNKAYTTRLSNFPVITEFVALFDNYRVNKVVWKFKPSYSVYPPSTTVAAGQALPQIVEIVDFDDSVVLSTTDAYLQYDTLKIRHGLHPWSRKYTPACLVDIGGIGNAGIRFKQWLDIADNSIDHYGLKIQFTPIAGTQTTWQCEVWETIYFSCRRVR